jgi:pyridoxine/pyridoxamine 5'-phosphate oxidase
MAVAGVRVAIAMLEEKKALSRTYLIIPSFWHYYRIVSVQEKFWRHKFYIKEFLSAGMLCARWLCL